PELQLPGTLEAARQLCNRGLITERELLGFESDWALLRCVEHRIHAWVGYQTHSIPSDARTREALAASLGSENAAALDETLAEARLRISNLFGSLFAEPLELHSPAVESLCDLVASGAPATEVAPHITSVLPITDAEEAASHLVRLARH